MNCSPFMWKTNCVDERETERKRTGGGGGRDFIYYNYSPPASFLRPYRLYMMTVLYLFCDMFILQFIYQFYFLFNVSISCFFFLYVLCHNKYIVKHNLPNTLHLVLNYKNSYLLR